MEIQQKYKETCLQGVATVFHTLFFPMFGMLKHKALTCQAQGFKDFELFFKNWTDLYTLETHSLEVWWLHDGKLQTSHRKALSMQCRHCLCDFMFKNVLSNYYAHG